MSSEAVRTPEDVLNFWFVELGPEKWFEKNPALDVAISKHFAATHLFLAHGDLDTWRGSREGHLASIIVLDQFSRNIYRGTPLAFATDWIALREARLAVDEGVDTGAGLHERCFLYLPFEHSEALEDQDRAVELFALLGDERYHDYAVRHREVIRQFGRFPHRNALLGRNSTPEELEYLALPGSGF